MPILNILINHKITSEQRTQLLEKSSQAVVDSIGAPLANVRATVQTLDTQDAIVAGEIGKTMAQVNVYLITGRTDDQKNSLIGALSRAIQDSTGVSSQDSRIILHDIERSDIGVAGGVSAKMLAT